MNARSLIVVAILLVLGVALWAAIYYGTAKSSDGSSISSPFSEFSATAMVRTEYSNYTIKVYSKLSFSGSSVASWILDAQVDYTDSHNRNFRHVYTNGLVFYGEMVGNYHNITVCQLFDQKKVLDEGSTSFVPTKIENPSPVYVCPQCNVWSLTLAQETFLLLEIGGVPQNVISRDQTIYVTSFTRDRTFVAPTIPASARALCDGNAGGPATPPANMNYSVQPQAAQSFPTQAAPEERVSSQVSRQLKKLIEERSTVVHNVQDLRIMHGEDSPLAQSKVAFVTQDVCDASRVGNGYCDAACNVATFNYDGGDCCPGCCLSARNKPYACGSNRFDCKPGSCGNRPCLFLHGLGCPGPRNGTFTQSKPFGPSSLLLTDYWGNLEYELQGICNTFIYNYHDTINYGWTDPILQDTYYNYAKAVQQQGGVIFAHSMANMILGGACMYNSAKCDVKWYMLAGPIRGSSVANTADLITSIFGFSVGGVYSLRTDTPGLGTATTRRGDLSRTIAEKSLLKGAACGTSAYGSGGLAGVGLYAVGRTVYGQECTGGYSWFFNICLGWSDVVNDGVVGLDECRYYTYNSGGTWYNWFIGMASFSTVRDSLWFLSAGNHLDMATAAGNNDGIMDWVRNMARRV